MVLPLLIALVFPVTGAVRLPSGVADVSQEMKIPDGAHDLVILGRGTTLRATANFRGRALLSCTRCRNVTFRDFQVDGARESLEERKALPPTDWPFARFYSNNAILVEEGSNIRFENLQFRNIAGFAILAKASHSVTVEGISVVDSGSRNAKGRNNTTGGVLFEEGTGPFAVRKSSFRNIRGNGVWTHSCYGSARNYDGVIEGNEFDLIGRDAVQVGHATRMRVQENHGTRIGFPVDLVDVETLGIPVGIDTAGNVDQTSYSRNHFEEINGKCMDLDGFHDGNITANTCVNRGRPEDYPFGNFGIAMNNASVDMHSRNIIISGNHLDGMKFGGMFLLGAGHKVFDNRMTHLNTAHCNETHARFGCIAILNEPGFLRSGIYLAARGEKVDPSRNIAIEHNFISGYKMAEHCIESAPGVDRSANTIRNNECRDE